MLGELLPVLRQLGPLLQADSAAAALPVDILELGDRYEMYVDVPGIDHKALTIELYDNPAVLAISGMRSEAVKSDKSAVWLRRERTPYGSVQRVFQLPPTVALERVTASYDKGELRLLLPKKQGMQQAKPTRQVAVSKL